MSNLIEFFQQIPLFKSLSPDELNDILRALQPREFGPGALIGEISLIDGKTRSASCRAGAQRPAPRPGR